MGFFISQRSPKVYQVALLAAIFLLANDVIAKSGDESSDKFPQIKIKNFGQMDERFYRGAQPDEEDYVALAALGIKIIFDLRNDPKEFARRAAEAAGMRYINIPMSDKDRPDDLQINDFLRAVGEAGKTSFYVHCRGGRHRTGVMGAVYRMEIYRWNYDQVYKEMKQYDYYSRWGHGDLKEYVQDYFVREQKERNVAAEETSIQQNK